MILLVIALLFLLWPKSVVAAGEEKVTILATADVHGRLLPWDYTTDKEDLTGSLAQIATLVKEIRKEEEHVILLDGGDLIQGNSSGLFRDEAVHPAILGLNTMEYDAWTLGNHEFDYGMERLHKVCGTFQGATLAGNLFDFKNPGQFPSWVILDRGPIKVGVIGMTTPMVQQFKKETNIFQNVHVTDPVYETKEAVRMLKGRVHVLVGLLHMGLDNENGIPHTGVRDVLRENPELDVVVAAHMHKLYDGVLVGNTLVAEPGKFGTHLLRMDLKFKCRGNQPYLAEKSSRLIPVAGEQTIAPAPEFLHLLLPYHLRARTVAEEPIGILEGAPLVAPDEIPGIPRVQVEETPLTDWISQVMLSASGAMVTAHQIDNDKAGLDPGIIRKKDIFKNYQYIGGEVTVYRVTGKDLKDYMEWSAGYFNRSVPGDITPSFRPGRRSLKYSTNDFFGGVCYTVDLRRPEGRRIRNLTFEDGEAILPDTVLTLGMNSYRMDALMGPKGPLEGRNIVSLYSTKDPDRYGSEGRIQNLMIRDIRKRKGILSLRPENRWKIVGPDPTLPGGEEGILLLKGGILTIPRGEEGTNIKSINVYEELDEKECKKIMKRAGLLGEYPRDYLAGEFYQWVYNRLQQRKLLGEEGRTI